MRVPISGEVRVALNILGGWMMDSLYKSWYKRQKSRCKFEILNSNYKSDMKSSHITKVQLILDVKAVSDK